MASYAHQPQGASALRLILILSSDRAVGEMMKNLTIGLLCSVAAANCFAGIVEDSGVKGGIVVQLGVESGEDLAELMVSDVYLVHALDKDSARVDKARADLRDKGLRIETSMVSSDCFCSVMSRNMPCRTLLPSST